MPPDRQVWRKQLGASQPALQLYNTQSKGQGVTIGTQSPVDNPAYRHIENPTASTSTPALTPLGDPFELMQRYERQVKQSQRKTC